MLILLPPSETKRDGGDGAPLDLAGLAFAPLAPVRRELVDALQELAADTEASVAALKLGRTQLFEVERNRRLTSSGTMPVIDRYTGVLYDALDAATLTPGARAYAHSHLVVHSALLGPVAALDGVPAYRMSHDSKLPALSLKKHWGSTIAEQLAPLPGVLLDLRSEAYTALGPLPVREGTAYLRVLSAGADGQKKALNHFNKKSKGEFTRALLEAGIDFGSIEELLSWAPSAGLTLQRHKAATAGKPEELALIV
ncbi:YaaA family protein [Microterricola pindariensis]|uniref:Peroxide stress protein YaaA n=1 Tax=Microterricola pindariensis TaxID=478010 RepID=A0ABX5AXH7_9MICO|nr:peroxide stress protein YaaA [Microterricola pindariensis]PPL19361.1 peroxide stress protein YaaA [Microterricola pindariensis]